MTASGRLPRQIRLAIPPNGTRDNDRSVTLLMLPSDQYIPFPNSRPVRETHKVIGKYANISESPAAPSVMLNVNSSNLCLTNQVNS